MSAAPVDNTCRDPRPPCPVWCDGHADGVGLSEDFDGLHVLHIARTDQHLEASNPSVWTDNEGAVFLERLDICSDDGTVKVGKPEVRFNVEWIDTADEVEDMAADLLAVAAKMRRGAR